MSEPSAPTSWPPCGEEVEPDPRSLPRTSSTRPVLGQGGKRTGGDRHRDGPRVERSGGKQHRAAGLLSLPLRISHRCAERHESHLSQKEEDKKWPHLFATSPMPTEVLR